MKHGQRADAAHHAGVTDAQVDPVVAHERVAGPQADDAAWRGPSRWRCGGSRRRHTPGPANGTGLALSDQTGSSAARPGLFERRLGCVESSHRGRARRDGSSDDTWTASKSNMLPCPVIAKSSAETRGDLIVSLFGPRI